MHATLYQTYYRSRIVTNIISAVRDYVYCAKYWNHLRKLAETLNLFLAFGPLETMVINISGPLAKGWCSFHYIMVIANQLTKLGQVVHLKDIPSLDVAKLFLEHCLYKYGPPKTLLPEN